MFLFHQIYPRHTHTHIHTHFSLESVKLMYRICIVLNTLIFQPVSHIKKIYIQIFLWGGGG